MRKWVHVHAVTPATSWRTGHAAGEQDHQRGLSSCPICRDVTGATGRAFGCQRSSVMGPSGR